MSQKKEEKIDRKDICTPEGDEPRRRARGENVLGTRLAELLAVSLEGPAIMRALFLWILETPDPPHTKPPRAGAIFQFPA